MKLPGAAAMVMKDRVMQGFTLVDAGAGRDTALHDWIGKALAYNATLPGKTAKPAGGKVQALKKQAFHLPSHLRGGLAAAIAASILSHGTTRPTWTRSKSPTLSSSLMATR